MPLTDDDFAKVGKPEEYTKIIEELMDQDDLDNKELEYDFALDDEDEDDD